MPRNGYQDFDVTHYRQRTRTGGSIGITKVIERATGASEEFIASRGELTKGQAIMNFKARRRP